MCGGQNQQQKDAETSQTQLDQQLAKQYQTGEAVTNPFATNLVTNPGQDPALAQQFANVKAQTKASNAGYGDALPSGFASGQQNQLNESYAKAQDSNMFNRQLTGAQLLNPMAAASAAQSGNNSVLQAPQNNFWGNLIQGMLAGGSQVGAAFAGA